MCFEILNSYKSVSPHITQTVCFIDIYDNAYYAQSDTT